MTEPRDPTLDVLLDLDGQVLVVDPEGGHWIRFVVTRVPMSPEKPHGIDYSLTLHGPEGERLVGFDNAHPVSRRKRGQAQDHRHRLRTMAGYGLVRLERGERGRITPKVMHDRVELDLPLTLSRKAG